MVTVLGGCVVSTVLDELDVDEAEVVGVVGVGKVVVDRELEIVVVALEDVTENELVDGLVLEEGIVVEDESVGLGIGVGGFSGFEVVDDDVLAELEPDPAAILLYIDNFELPPH